MNKRCSSSKRVVLINMLTFSIEYPVQLLIPTLISSPAAELKVHPSSTGKMFNSKQLECQLKARTRVVKSEIARKTLIPLPRSHHPHTQFPRELLSARQITSVFVECISSSSFPIHYGCWSHNSGLGFPPPRSPS